MATVTKEQAVNRWEVETALSPDDVRRLFPGIDHVIRAAHYEPDPLESQHGRLLPMQLVERYAKLAAWRADTERLEDGTWYAEVRGFPGVWAQADSEDEAAGEIEAVVKDWTLLKILDKDRDLPVIGMIDLNVF